MFISVSPADAPNKGADRAESSRSQPRVRIAVLVAALVVTACASPALPTQSTANAGTTGSLWAPASRATVAVRPLSFEPNRGQAGPEVGFLAHGNGYSVALTATSTTFSMGERAGDGVRMTLLDSNPAAPGRGEQLLPGTVGYVGVQAARPALNDIPTYAAVRYAGVYPRIDLFYYGRQQQLEYDFRVAPGADPSRIRLAVQGVEQLSVAANGDVILHAAGGVVRQHRPFIYQMVHGARLVISGGYVLEGHTVRFRLGAYNHNAPLVIDPVLEYSTYYGGPGDDFGNGIAVDAQGNAYIVGTTTSGTKTRMAFISKFDPSGKRVLYTKFVSNIYSTHKTACDSTGTGIAVDSHGNAYITGMYGYEDEFNLCNNQAVLWAKVDPTGTIVVDIFGKYGGSKGNAMTLDPQGNTYVTGATDQWEKNFPVTAGAFQPLPGIDKEQHGLAGDAFVLKINPTGQVVYGTFLGGSYIDEGLGIAVDRQGRAYVVGNAGSSNFPVTTDALQTRLGNPYANGFLSILSADGSSLVYSTFLSGNNGEDLTGVAVDAHGNAYVVGSSDSPNFPTTPNAYKRSCGGDGMCDPGKTWYTDYSSNTSYWHINVAEDIVVAVIDPSQSGTASLRYSTFIGGRGRDLGTAIAVDKSGRAYVTGRTAAPNFPGAQATTGSSYDAVLSVIDPRKSGAGSLVASTAFGGSGYDEGDGIAVDRNGNIYVTGYTGSARSFPTLRPLQAANAGRYDALVLKIGGLASS